MFRSAAIPLADLDQMPENQNDSGYQTSLAKIISGMNREASLNKSHGVNIFSFKFGF